MKAEAACSPLAWHSSGVEVLAGQRCNMIRNLFSVAWLFLACKLMCFWPSELFYGTALNRRWITFSWSCQNSDAKLN